jgi:hypothetical protein
VDRIVSAAQVAAMLPPRATGTPAYQGLAESLRLLILDGQLVADLRLPSERELSGALQLSRSTVAGAYALLRERGLLTARRGAGNYVTVDTGSLTSELLPAPTFSRDGMIGLTCASSEAPAGLAGAYARALEQLPGLLAGTGYFPDGLPVLREQLAAWFTGRGLPTSADQLIITAGALAGLNVVARALLSPGDRVLLESPTYSNAITALHRSGARPVGLPVGGQADPWEAWDVEQTPAAGPASPGLPDPGLPQPDRPPDAGRPARPGRDGAAPAPDRGGGRREPGRAVPRRGRATASVRLVRARRRDDRLGQQGLLGRPADRLAASLRTPWWDGW